MAKKTRIPELVVNKIYIDGGGSSSQVYTLEVDDGDDHKLKIGNNKNKKVATINQRTGEIEAAKIKGDGSGLTNVSAEALAEIEAAKLLTLSTDKIFFSYKENGQSDPSGQTVTIKANIQNVPGAQVVWSSTDATFTVPVTQESPDEVTITAAQFNANSERKFLSIIATIDDEGSQLYDQITIVRIEQGATGRSALTTVLTNESHTYQADRGVTGNATVADFSSGATDIVVFYGATRLKPVTGEPGAGEFKVEVSLLEYIQVPAVNHILPVAVEGNEDSWRMEIASPTGMTANNGTITFEITAKNPEGDDAYVIKKIQSFAKSVEGAVGDDAQVVKMLADDYQVAYNADGAEPSPQFVIVTADAKNHGETPTYRFSVDEGDGFKPWTPGVGTTGAGGPLPAGTEHNFQAGFTQAKIIADSSHASFGGKKIVKVESSADGEEEVASDIISIIGTKDGSNAIMITADNLTHAFPATYGGAIADYEDASIQFELYNGNDRQLPQILDLSENLDALDNLDKGKYTVKADASNFVNESNVEVETIVPGEPEINFSNTYAIDFFPTSMEAVRNRAAIVYSFWSRDSSDTLIGPITQTQTFVKAREGNDGTPGLPGDPGADSKAVKLTADDYQVAYDEHGANPDTFSHAWNADTSEFDIPQIIFKADKQNVASNRDVYRFSVDDAIVPPVVGDAEYISFDQPSGMGNDGWRKPLGQNPGVFQDLLIDDKYDDFGKKKVVKVELGEYTHNYNPEYAVDIKIFDGIVATDSVSVIATKEGSNAVEVVADNLAHVFPQNENDVIDYSDGNIGFEVYIGNEQLLPWRGIQSNEGGGVWLPGSGGEFSFDNSAPKNTFHIAPLGTGIDPGDALNATYQNEPQFHGQQGWDGGYRFEYGPPSEMTGDKASIKYEIRVKDGNGIAGTIRPTFTRIQTFTKTRQPADAKVMRLNASSYAFLFDDRTDITATPESISVFLEPQNVEGGVSFENVTIKDKWDAEITEWSTGNPPDVFTDTGGIKYFNINLFDFAKHATLSSAIPTEGDWYSEASAENIPAEWLFAVKNDLFPITVQLQKTNISGDKISIHTINGGTDTLNILIPNDNHTFPADFDANVDELDFEDGDSEIIVYQGADKLTYDDSATPAAGTYKFGDMVYRSRGNIKEGDARTVELYEPGDAEFAGDEIKIKLVRPSAKSNTVAIPFVITKKNGTTVETIEKIVTYSIAKDGRDGANLKDRNYDFSQGSTGWSLDNAAGTTADMLTYQFNTLPDPDDKGTYGTKVAFFPSSHIAEDGEAPRMSKKIYLAEPLPIGDLGKFEIIFRAKTNHEHATNMGDSTLKAKLFIQTYDAQGLPGTITDDNYIYFPRLLQSWMGAGGASAGINTGPWENGNLIKALPDIAAQTAQADGSLSALWYLSDTFTSATKKAHGAKLPICNDRYQTFNALILPSTIKELQEAAVEFKIGLEYEYVKDADGDGLLDIDSNGTPEWTYQLINESGKGLYVDVYGVSIVAEAVVKNETAGAENAAANHHTNEDVAAGSPESIYNGKLNILAPDGYPAGILTSRFNAAATFEERAAMRDPESDIIPDPNGEQGVIIMAAGASDDGIPGNGQIDRKGLIFRAIKIPSPDHRLKVTIRYYRTPGNDDSDSDYPSMYVYYSDDDLTGDQRYIASSTKTFATSHDDRGLSTYGDNIVSVAYRTGADNTTGWNSIDGGDNLYSYKNLEKTGTATAWAVDTHEVTFGEDSNWSNLYERGTGEPKWMSIHILGAKEDNYSQILKKFQLNGNSWQGLLLQKPKKMVR